VFDTSLVAIRRARAAQIGSTSCPVTHGIVRAVAPRDTSSSPERKHARTFGEASDAECTTGNGACVCGMRDGGAHRAG